MKVLKRIAASLAFVLLVVITPFVAVAFGFVWIVTGKDNFTKMYETIFDHLEEMTK